MPFQKGNKLGGSKDKSTKLSTWLLKELDREYDTSTREGYDKKMQAAKALARMIVQKTLEAETLKEMLEGAGFIADRTEGKASQGINLVSEDGSMSPVKGLTSEQLVEIIAGRTGGAGTGKA